MAIVFQHNKEPYLTPLDFHASLVAKLTFFKTEKDTLD
jgi:hypothetical protein